VLIGEMRDLETIEAALNIAETGHLTFATLHTSSCVSSINRVIDVFPPTSRCRFAPSSPSSWRACCASNSSARLGVGRVLSVEVMIPNAAIRNLIREDKSHQVYSQMQVGQSKYGMQTMNQSLVDLYKKG